MPRKLKMNELNRLDVAGFKASKKAPIVLILDNIRSALNVGSAFRTADAFKIANIGLCGITAQPPHREILKTALGASKSVDWQYFKETTDAIQHYKKEGYTILAVEQVKPSISLEDYQLKQNEKIALIFGNEVKGVSQEAVSLADAGLEIPQFGTKHSLNISVCVGIVVWEFYRKLYFD
ncbi:MAG: RNA methyltransferase [Saprospiraceae bacterium]|nr:RNA methyltransferase [Saprospiraceae bacterium]